MPTEKVTPVGMLHLDEEDLVLSVVESLNPRKWKILFSAEERTQESFDMLKAFVEFHEACRNANQDPLAVAREIGTAFEILKAAADGLSPLSVSEHAKLLLTRIGMK